MAANIYKCFIDVVLLEYLTFVEAGRYWYNEIRIKAVAFIEGGVITIL